MSKDLFLMMREQEVAHVAEFPTKKQLEQNAKQFAANLIDSGEFDKFEAFAQAERITLAVSTVRDELKAALPREKDVRFGIEIVPVNGRQMIQYADDPIYADILAKLKNREELLKAALKSDEPFYDSQGIEVPKVSVKYSADSLQAKY